MRNLGSRGAASEWHLKNLVALHKILVFFKAALHCFSTMKDFFIKTFLLNSTTLFSLTHLFSRLVSQTLKCRFRSEKADEKLPLPSDWY